MPPEYICTEGYTLSIKSTLERLGKACGLFLSYLS